jgi:phosphatidylserine/phosphatidylglycerophosphate/cardiolipin synthase-like enzyme
MDDWSSAANPSDLDLVAQALEDRRLPPRDPPVAAVQRLGIADVSGVRAFLAAAPSHDPAALAWHLRRLATERRGWMDRHARSAQVVWSGRSATQSLRDTRAVLDELCDRAERHVLLATYVVYDGRRSLAPLARRMRALPSLRVECFVDLRSAREGADGDREAAAAWLRTFRAEHWPDDLRLPDIWYSPTTLHAKCVVVDGRWVFVTSANFTEAAQARNIEVGVLLDHPALAQSLAAQFQGLQKSGELRRLSGG